MKVGVRVRGFRRFWTRCVYEMRVVIGYASESLSCSRYSLISDGFFFFFSCCCYLVFAWWRGWLYFFFIFFQFEPLRKDDPDRSLSIEALCFLTVMFGLSRGTEGSRLILLSLYYDTFFFGGGGGFSSR